MNRTLFLFLFSSQILMKCAAGKMRVQDDVYMTDGAYNVSLGEVGSLHRHLFGDPVFDFLARFVSKEAVTNMISLKTQITYGSDSQSVRAAQIQFFEAVSSTFTNSNGNVLTNRFQIVALDKEKAVKELNAPQNAGLRRNLASNKNARLITAVAILYDDKLESSLTNDLSLNATSNLVKQIGIDTRISRSKKMSRVYSDQTIFAYQLSRLCWNVGDDDEPMVASLSSDNSSDNCNSGDMNSVQMSDWMKKWTESSNHKPLHFYYKSIRLMDEASYINKGKYTTLSNLNNRYTTEYVIRKGHPEDLHIAVYVIVDGYAKDTNGNIDLEFSTFFEDNNKKILAAGSNPDLFKVSEWENRPIPHDNFPDKFAEFVGLPYHDPKCVAIPYPFILDLFTMNEIPADYGFVRIEVVDKIAKARRDVSIRLHFVYAE